MIIDGKQKRSLKAIELFITSLGWVYILNFFIQFTFSLFLWNLNIKHMFNELFIFRNLMGTTKITAITVIAAVFNVAVMFLWRNYNRIRFGGLKRRWFPKDTDVNALSKYFGLTVEEVVKLQNNKWTELQKTIV